VPEVKDAAVAMTVDEAFVALHVPKVNTLSPARHKVHAMLGKESHLTR
jgi:hypothetical protein